MDNAQNSFSTFLGDLSQSEKLSKIKAPLNRMFLLLDGVLLLNQVDNDLEDGLGALPSSFFNWLTKSLLTFLITVELGDNLRSGGIVELYKRKILTTTTLSIIMSYLGGNLDWVLVLSLCSICLL